MIVPAAVAALALALAFATALAAASLWPLLGKVASTEALLVQVVAYLAIVGENRHGLFFLEDDLV